MDRAKIILQHPYLIKFRIQNYFFLYFYYCRVYNYIRTAGDMADFDQGERPEEKTYSEKDYTLIFCRRVNPETNEREVLLGMKKRGFGQGKWNGFGGKLEGDETIEQGTIRELQEESGIVANTIKRMGYLVFKMVESGKIMRVHVYETWDFQNEPVESEEMRPKWYTESSIPYALMWLDDPYWLPLLLQGKTFLGRYVHLISHYVLT